MDRMTSDLIKIYRRQAVTPVIVEAREGYYFSLRDRLRSIVPVELLEAKFHTFTPRIMPLIEFPFSKWKEIKMFNMIATVLTPELIEEVAQWREVERMYPDYMVWAISTPRFPASHRFFFQEEEAPPEEMAPPEEAPEEAPPEEIVPPEEVIPVEEVTPAPPPPSPPIRVPPQGIFRDIECRPFTSTFWTKRMMGLDRANLKGFTGKGVIVAVIDTGARLTHEQLRGRVKILTAAPEKGMSGTDTNGHGSYCASVIGGRYAIDRRYKVPVEGMATDCTLISIQAMGFIIGIGCTSDLLKAMEMSIGLGAKVVSMSLGSGIAVREEENPQAKAINKMVEAGIIPVCAAGNEGPEPGTVTSPGCCLNSLTVGAWNELEGKIADFSGRGPTVDGYIKPDVVAPGVRINSALVGLLDGLTDPTQLHYGPLTGSSMSVPHVAGLVACMVQLYRDRVGLELTVDEIKRMMSEIGPNQPKDNNVGWGLISWDLVEYWCESEYGIKI